MMHETRSSNGSEEKMRRWLGNSQNAGWFLVTATLTATVMAGKNHTTKPLLLPNENKDNALHSHLPTCSR